MAAAQALVLTDMIRPTDHAGGRSPGGRIESPDSQNWAPLVDGIRQGDPAADEALYHIINRGVRFKLRREMPHSDVDDRVHDIYLIVLETIRRGRLRKPDRLLGFIRTVARRQVAAYIDAVVEARNRFKAVDTCREGPIVPANDGPQDRVLLRETHEILAHVLGSQSKRNREVLRRFYLEQQPAAQICREMDLTETQFRLLKSRAKKRFEAAALMALGRPLRKPAAKVELSPASGKNRESSFVPAMPRTAATA